MTEQYSENVVLRNRIASVLVNAANYPVPVRPHILGQPLGALIAAVTDAVLPLSEEARAEAWDECVREMHDLGWLHDYAKSDALERNPHRPSVPSAPRGCAPKSGWLSDETYCALHGRDAGWPCASSLPFGGQS